MGEAIPLTPLDDAAGSGRTWYPIRMLAGEQHGVGMLPVDEIRGWGQGTRIPNPPACVKGVIDLRGPIVAILDFPLRFGIPAESYCKRTVLIVARSKSRRGYDRSMGFVVGAIP